MFNSGICTFSQLHYHVIYVKLKRLILTEWHKGIMNRLKQDVKGSVCRQRNNTLAVTLRVNSATHSCGTCIFKYFWHLASDLHVERATVWDTMSSVTAVGDWSPQRLLQSAMQGCGSNQKLMRKQWNVCASVCITLHLCICVHIPEFICSFMCFICVVG